MLRQRFSALLSDRTAMAGAALLGLMITLAVLAPLLGGDPHLVDPTSTLRPPSMSHWFGTDEKGRDLWTMVVHGARTSLAIGAVATALAVVTGYLLGVLCGYFRWVDAVVMRVVDGLMSFPSIVLVISLVGVLGDGVATMITGLTVVLIPMVTRVVRGAALAVKAMPMVESTTSLGSRTSWVLLRYVAPEALSVTIVQATLAFSVTVLSVAALSFLGIGLPPDVPSWGTSLSAAQQYFYSAWWIGVFPGLAIVLTVLGLVLLGDGLRDVFDPRSARK